MARRVDVYSAHVHIHNTAREAAIPFIHDASRTDNERAYDTALANLNKLCSYSYRTRCLRECDRAIVLARQGRYEPTKHGRDVQNDEFGRLMPGDRSQKVFEFRRLQAIKRELEAPLALQGDYNSIFDVPAAKAEYQSLPEAERKHFWFRCFDDCKLMIYWEARGLFGFGSKSNWPTVLEADRAITLGSIA